jgi:oxygen-dependent protoporphyrinogen oxidase
VRTASSAAARRYLLEDGRLVPLPGDPLQALRAPGFGVRATLRALAEPLVRRPPPPGETLAGLLRRRLGRRVAAQLADPLAAGIFGGDADQVEAASALPRLAQLEATYGSLILGGLRQPRPRGPRGPYTFDEGLEVLPRALAQALGPDLSLATPVQRIEASAGAFRVHHAGGQLRARRVALAIPPDLAASLYPLPEPVPLDRAPIAAVHLGFDASDLPRPLDGFGWLVRAAERRDVLGALWISAVFPSHAPPGSVSIRLMIGGDRAPELVELPDSWLVDHACRVLRDVQRVTATPTVAHLARHLPGIPQPRPGHAARVDRLRRALPPGLTLHGWGYGGLGLTDALGG